MSRIFLGMVVTLIVGQTAPPSWRSFSPKDGSFTVSLPMAPKEKKQQLKLPMGAVDVSLFICEGPGERTLVVGVSEFPENSAPGGEEKRLRNARDGAVQNVQGKLLHERKIALTNYPGRELWIETKDASVIHTRLYAVKQRLYQTMAIGPKEAVETKEVAGFMDSFQLKK